MVSGKKLSEAFPISMYVDGHGWKLSVSLPKNLKDHKLFEFCINGKNFLDLEFIMVEEYRLKTLRGEIILNDVTWLDKDSRFDWKPQLAENRIVSKLDVKPDEDPPITRIVLKNM